MLQLGTDNIEHIDYHIIMKSWKTTVLGAGGLLAIIVTAVSAMFDGDPATNPQWGMLIAAAGPAIASLFARDHSVTSEQAGAK